MEEEEKKEAEEVVIGEEQITEEEEPKVRSAKQFASDTAIAVGSIRKVLDVVPIMEHYDWFNADMFDQEGLIQMATFYAMKYNLSVKHILTVLGESLKKEKKKPVPEC